MESNKDGLLPVLTEEELDDWGEECIKEDYCPEKREWCLCPRLSAIAEIKYLRKIVAGKYDGR